MALPFIFNNLAAGNQPASDLDTNFNAVGFMAITQCTATGTNSITLVPNSNQPTIAAYANYQQFSFVPAGASTGSVTIAVNSLAALNVYLSDGATQAASGTFSTSMVVVVAYNSALNSGAGGFIILSAQGIVPSVQSAANYLSPGGYINKFRNGNFDVAQRGTGGTVTASNTVYTIDGWRLTPSGANLTWSQVYGQILGFSGNFLRINCASGLTQVQFDQPIESFVAASLAGQQVTMQFIISNVTSSSIAPQFFVTYANSQDNFSSQTTILTGSFQTIPSNNSVIVSYTFAMPSNASNGIDVAIQFGSGLNAASGNVFIGRADIRATPGVATGLNSTPPVPEVRPIAAELAFCQRYYETSYGNGIAPGTATHAGIPVAVYGAFGVRFSVPKRAAPSISYWDGVGNASKVSQLSSTVNSWTDNITPSGAGGFNTPGTTGFSVYLSSLGNVYGFHWSATAEF
jgi:hypothetical protein